MVNNHMVIWLRSPLEGWSPSKWPNFMAYYTWGVAIATYIHWEENLLQVNKIISSFAGFLKSEIKIDRHLTIVCVCCLKKQLINIKTPEAKTCPTNTHGNITPRPSSTSL